MILGAGRIFLDFYNNEKASKKSQLLESLCRDLRKKFNISAMEIAEFDDPEKGVIGFSVVFPETWKTLRMKKALEKICNTIDQTAAARVMMEDCDLVSFGD